MARAALIALAAVALLAAGGCTRTDTTDLADGHTLRLKIDEYKLSPLTTNVKAGKLTIRVVNDGKLSHNVAVARQGNVVIGRTTTMNPGQSAQMTVSLDPGTYRVFSSLSNDDALGLNGFVVAK